MMSVNAMPLVIPRNEYSERELEIIDSLSCWPKPDNFETWCRFEYEMEEQKGFWEDVCEELVQQPEDMFTRIIAWDDDNYDKLYNIAVWVFNETLIDEINQYFA